MASVSPFHGYRNTPRPVGPTPFAAPINFGCPTYRHPVPSLSHRHCL